MCTYNNMSALDKRPRSNTNELNDFSTLPLENVFVKTEPDVITAKEYYQNNIVLKKYKIPELKTIARFHKLSVTGNKPALIERIEQFFMKTSRIVIVQKICRGRIARQFLRLKGPAVKNRAMCNNETDFCTMEPIDEIPFELFFSYTDANNFTYGFNILSLMNVFNRKGKIQNPYNRSTLDLAINKRISTLSRLVYILYPASCDESILSNRVITKKPCPRTRQRHSEEPGVGIQELAQHIQMLENLNRLAIKLREIRLRPLNTRIVDVFSEIDAVGNYTQSSWFSTLNKREYVQFYRCLYELWNYRAQMTYDTKRKICILDGHNPFRGTYISTYSREYNEVSIETLCTMCVTVIENMIYACADVEFQRLGALHVLSALSMVSIPARNSSALMMSLYESVIY